MKTVILYLAPSPSGDSSFRRARSLLLYFLLLGVPLLGLLGILLFGDGRDPSLSVGGTWVVEQSTSETMQRACAPLDLPGSSPEMTISRSGKNLRLEFNDANRTAMVGRLHAGTITVRQVLPSGGHVANICGALATVVLQLHLQRRAGEADRLLGSWRIPECGVCSTQPFRAVRRAS